MRIGIDASRAFLGKRTGIEEYSYQVIKHLRDVLPGGRVVLYVRKSQKAQVESEKWPDNWEIRIIKLPRFWTQLGLSLEMLLRPVDALFVPAHTVPFIHPSRTVVTVHGLEYEFVPETYSLWERVYMRFSIRNSCRWAQKIISVSENTKKDLIDLYKVDENKIKIVPEGWNDGHQSSISSQQEKGDGRLPVAGDKYLLFIGRIEGRKNVGNIVKALEILKEKNDIPHKLILAGRPGYGYGKIKSQIASSKSREDILELGFVSEREKWELLANAECFLFPTLYEGFGIPILEAQSAGCPVVASDNSSIPEVAGKSALLVDPRNPEAIAAAISKIISDESFKKDLIEKGLENVQRFSWRKCATQIAKILEA